MITQDQILDTAADDTPIHSWLCVHPDIKVIITTASDATQQAGETPFDKFFSSLERPSEPEIQREILTFYTYYQGPVSLEGALKNYYHYAAPFICSYSWLLNYFESKGETAARKAFNRLSARRKSYVCMGRLMRFPYQAQGMHVPGILLDGGLYDICVHLKENPKSAFEFPAYATRGNI